MLRPSAFFGIRRGLVGEAFGVAGFGRKLDAKASGGVAERRVGGRLCGLAFMEARFVRQLLEQESGGGAGGLVAGHGRSPVGRGCRRPVRRNAEFPGWSGKRGSPGSAFAEFAGCRDCRDGPGHAGGPWPGRRLEAVVVAKSFGVAGLDGIG